MPPLLAGEVQVWRVAAGSVLPRCVALLDEGERARADRYRVAAARDEFSAARGCLRMLLGDALGVRPEAVALKLDEFGKPSLADDAGVEFNVTHSHGAILIALCLGSAVGIDVEKIDPKVEIAEIARGSFTAREAAAIEQAATPEERLGAFFRCWTQKEAVTKADGRGLNLPLASFEIPVQRRSWHSVEVEERSFCVSEFAFEDGYAAAIAVEMRQAYCRFLVKA
jgi:4'-phosphopantetheinyl transferase